MTRRTALQTDILDHLDPGTLQSAAAIAQALGLTLPQISASLGVLRRQGLAVAVEVGPDTRLWRKGDGTVPPVPPPPSPKPTAPDPEPGPAPRPIPPGAFEDVPPGLLARLERRLLPYAAPFNPRRALPCHELHRIGEAAHF